MSKSKHNRQVPRGTFFSNQEIERIRRAYKANEGIKDGWLIILAKEMGRPYGSISAVGSRLGLGNKKRLSRNKYSFSDKEKRIIKKAYMMNINRRGWLDKLSTQMGRDKHSICRCARRMGLTTSIRGWENGQHPKGMFGKTHTSDYREKMSERVKKSWKDPTSKFNSLEFKRKRSLISSQNMKRRIELHPSSIYSYAKKGWLEFEGGKKRYFFRSQWEMNYAIYLDRQKKEKRIHDWWYEKDTFLFDKIKKGTRCYTPDFKINGLDGEIVYHEVKGWMDSKSKTKLKRMAKYYPETKIVLVDEKTYRKMEKEGAFSFV